MATSKEILVSETEELGTVHQQRTTLKSSKPSKSLFSVANGQSLRSQLSDLTLVLRWMLDTTYHSPSPTKFAVDYILNPRLKNDRFVVGFGLPALAGTPRVLSQAPGPRSGVSEWTYHGQRTAETRKAVVNVASYNYLGFIDLSQDDRDLLEYAIRSLPLAGDSHGGRLGLEKEVENELSRYFGMDGCVLTASGYSINLVAFPAMARSSLETHLVCPGPPPILLMDSESHSSMFVGAYIASAQTGAKIVKFKHNDADDLQHKLEDLFGPASEVSAVAASHAWVCIEGLYSMDGTVPPLPAIVALKKTYGFRIYIDEAHSLLSLGHTGRGVVEHFQDAHSDEPLVSNANVDMIGGTMSKSFSSVGGLVLFRQEIEQHVDERVREMGASDTSSISTPSLIRTLQILKASEEIVKRLSHLHHISAYIASVLHAKGYQVSTTPGGPFIALILDNVNRVLEFLRVGREIGLLCCGAAYPAAPRGAPRIRLSLTGAHTWQDVEDILRLIDDVSARIRVKRKGTRLNTVPPVASAEKEEMVASSAEMDSSENDNFSSTAKAATLACCPQPMSSETEGAKCVRLAGVDALHQFGLGAAGPRWMCGTTSAHMSLEQLLNTTVGGLLPAYTHGLSGEKISTTLFTDASVGLLSLVSVSMEALTNRRAKTGERHLVFLPANSKVEYKEGAFASSRHRSVVTYWHTGTNAMDLETASVDTPIREILEKDRGTPTKSHITLHIDADLLHPEDVSSEQSQLTEAVAEILSPFQEPRHLSLTLIIHDNRAFKTSFATTERILATLERSFPGIFASRHVQWLLYSSLTTLPHVAGIQGAFATGSRRLIEKIQFLGPGVMYTAMMPALNAAMAEESIRQVLRSPDSKLASRKAEAQ